MDRRASSVLLTLVFVLSSLATPFLEGGTYASSDNNILEKTALSDAFVGFSSEEGVDFLQFTIIQMSAYSSIITPMPVKLLVGLLSMPGIFRMTISSFSMTQIRQPKKPSIETNSMCISLLLS